MDTELLVPCGINPAGLLVSAADADRTTEYRCPECQSVLVLRAGEVVVHHFAHKADTACTGETISHETAKRLLAQVIREQTAIESPQTISLACTCDRCASAFLVQLPRDRFTRAAVEHRVGDFVCDVAGLKNDEVVLALEVLATHAVPEAKAHALYVPWIEVTAESVLTDPYRWTPTNSRLKPVVCPSCKTFLGKLMVLAERWDIPLDRLAGYRDPARATYLAAIEPCWKCGEEFLCSGGLGFHSVKQNHRNPDLGLFRISTRGLSVESTGQTHAPAATPSRATTLFSLDIRALQHSKDCLCAIHRSFNALGSIREVG